MDAITALATDYGLDLLNSTLKNTATKYALLGATTHDKADSEASTFYQAEIETSYFDNNGVLTFIINLPVEQDFKKYLYAIVILDSTDRIVIRANTPKIALASGIGGMVTIKAAVTGEAGEIIFKATDYITTSEMNDIWMIPVIANATAIIYNATRQLKHHKRIIELEAKS